VRTSTAIGRNAVSVSHVAVELARKIYGDMGGRQVLLIGTGKMSQIAARQLVAGGAHATVVGGRRFERACELADALGGTAVPFEALGQELVRADVVISGTGAPGIIVTRAEVEQACAARRHRPLFLIDIAVPRDIDPTVRELRAVFLYDLDDLKAVADANLRERQREAGEAEAMVEEAVRGYLDWQRSRDVVPVLVELRQRAEQIRRAELERARKRLGPLTPQQEEAIEHLTNAIVQKLLHAPSVQLRELAGDGHPAADLSFLRRLLGL
jgi:glutamyl-tRNA reductase